LRAEARWARPEAVLLRAEEQHNEMSRERSFDWSNMTETVDWDTEKESSQSMKRRAIEGAPLVSSGALWAVAALGLLADESTMCNSRICGSWII